VALAPSASDLVSGSELGQVTTTASGGVFVYQEPDCVGNNKHPKVTLPFRIGVTGLEPNSTGLAEVSGLGRKTVTAIVSPLD